MKTKKILSGIALVAILLIGGLMLFAACEDGVNGPGNDPEEAPNSGNPPPDNREKFTITVEGPFLNGDITVKDDLEEAAEGDTVILVPIPVANYFLRSVTVEDQYGDTIDVELIEGEWTFIMPDGPVFVVSAVFAVTMYQITPTQAAGGTFTVSRQEAAFNTSITVNVTPDRGKYIKSASVIGVSTNEPVSATVNNESNTVNFRMPGENVTVTLEYGDMVLVDDNFVFEDFSHSGNFGSNAGYGGNYWAWTNTTAVFTTQDGRQCASLPYSGNNNHSIGNSNRAVEFGESEEISVWFRFPSTTVAFFFGLDTHPDGADEIRYRTANITVAAANTWQQFRFDLMTDFTLDPSCSADVRAANPVSFATEKGKAKGWRLVKQTNSGTGTAYIGEIAVVGKKWVMPD